ncbi:MAG: FAD-dependent thymidylate synthase, partial [bacterium]|nr:FAD-dependent thymidylate synthase [bacterium]
MAEVTALAGWPPEVLAYAFAKYSRSPLSIRQSIQTITAEKGGKFLEDFYFQFGHRSIADNAHAPLALENISQIAAFALENEQLWDGSERSTRFQNFGESGYYVPTSVRGTPLELLYIRGADFLLEQYKLFSTRCFEHLIKSVPKPADMKPDVYERALKARAFDNARYWLFNGMFTSVGQITSARTLEGQISRLMSSEYPELQELGQKMKEACIGKPFCPEGKDELPIAPTLVKYAAP